MELSQVVAGSIDGWSMKDLEMLLAAVGRSEGNKREFLRLARFADAGYSGRASINMNKGNITEAKYVTSSAALSRLLDARGG